MNGQQLNVQYARWLSVARKLTQGTPMHNRNDRTLVDGNNAVCHSLWNCYQSKLHNSRIKHISYRRSITGQCSLLSCWQLMSGYWCHNTVKRCGQSHSHSSTMPVDTRARPLLHPRMFPAAVTPRTCSYMHSNCQLFWWQTFNMQFLSQFNQH